MVWDPNKKTLSQTLEAQGRPEANAVNTQQTPPPTPTTTAPTTTTTTNSSYTNPYNPNWDKTNQLGEELTNNREQAQKDWAAAHPTTQPVPGETTAPVPGNNEPKPLTNTDTTSTTQTSTTGIPTREELLKAGVDPKAVDEVMAKLSPFIAGQEKAMATENAKRDFIVNDVQEEQKKVEEQANKIKEQQTLLASEQQKIVDESAAISKEALAQTAARERLLNEEARKKYESDQKINLRDTERANRELELKVSRSLSSSMGKAFSFSGLQQIADIEQKGIDIISSLKSETAWGDAQFTFKANGIEDKYITETLKIENQRKDGNLSILSELQKVLIATDEKVLLSYTEKKKIARDAIVSAYEQKEQNDLSAASEYMEATDMMFTRTKELTEEKRDKETFDATMSSNLGYYANKYGEAINKDANGNPKPFTGQYDEKLSNAMGFLVDNRGNKILDSQGQTIRYSNPELDAVKKAREAAANGTATPYQMTLLNGRVGENTYISSKKKNGSYGGQCGTFVRSQFTNEEGWETVCFGGGWAKLKYDNQNACHLDQKKKMVNQRGFKVGEGQPKVGDVVVFTENYGAVGHYAIINKISEDGSSMTLSESNRKLNGLVENNRTIPINANGVYGFFTPDLKKEVIDNMPKVQDGDPSSEGPTPTTSISYPGRPTPPPWASNYSKYIHTDSYGNTSINWTGLPASYKTTQAERAEAEYAVAMQKSEDLLNMYKQAGIDIGSANDALSGLSNDAKLTGDTIQKLVSQNIISEQQADVIAAQSRWMEASLRKKSGAAINVGEYLAEAANNFAPPGSGDQAYENKRSARQSLISTFVQGSGKADIMYNAYLSAPTTMKPITGGDTTKSNVTKAVEGGGNLLKQGTDALASAWGSLTNQQPTPTTAPANVDTSNVADDDMAEIYSIKKK